MKPGPPPKPTRLRVLEGNPSKRPLYTDEPMPRQRAPDKPDDLSPVASEEWDRIVPELDRLGILSPLDRTMLVVYCEAVEIYTLALAKVRESGVLIKGDEPLPLSERSPIICKRWRRWLREIDFRVEPLPVGQNPLPRPATAWAPEPPLASGLCRVRRKELLPTGAEVPCGRFHRRSRRALLRSG